MDRYLGVGVICLISLSSSLRMIFRLGEVAVGQFCHPYSTLVCWVFISLKTDACNINVFNNSSFVSLDTVRNIDRCVFTRKWVRENFAASQHVTMDTIDQYVMIALPPGNTKMT